MMPTTVMAVTLASWMTVLTVPDAEPAEVMGTWTTAALTCGYLILAHTDVTNLSRPRRRKRTP